MLRLAVSLFVGIMAVSVQAKPGCDLILEPKQDILAAINKAKNGAVVCLKPGRYRTGGNIEISVTIRPLEKHGKFVFSDGLMVNWTDVKHPLHIVLDGLVFDQAGKDSPGQGMAKVNPGCCN